MGVVRTRSYACSLRSRIPAPSWSSRSFSSGRRQEADLASSLERRCPGLGRRLLRLRNGIAKRVCILTDTVVPGNDRHQRRRLTEQLRCRKMNGVERANGFDGERAADSRDHGVCYGHDIAATFKPPQCLYRRTLLFGCQSSGNPGTKDGPSVPADDRVSRELCLASFGIASSDTAALPRFWSIASISNDSSGNQSPENRR
jgi:hypothetical protein